MPSFHCFGRCKEQMLRFRKTSVISVRAWLCFGGDCMHICVWLFLGKCLHTSRGVCVCVSVCPCKSELVLWIQHVVCICFHLQHIHQALISLLWVACSIRERRHTVQDFATFIERNSQSDFFKFVCVLLQLLVSSWTDLWVSGLRVEAHLTQGAQLFLWRACLFFDLLPRSSNERSRVLGDRLIFPCEAHPLRERQAVLCPSRCMLF